MELDFCSCKETSADTQTVKKCTRKCNEVVLGNAMEKQFRDIANRRDGVQWCRFLEVNGDCVILSKPREPTMSIFKLAKTFPLALALVLTGSMAARAQASDSPANDADDAALSERQWMRSIQSALIN